MKRLPIHSLLPLFILILAVACARLQPEVTDGDGAVSAVTPTEAEPTTAATTTSAASRTPRPAPSPTATAAPPEPALSAVQQTVGEDGIVVISRIAAPEPAWVVVYADADGAPGEVLGYREVAAGEHRDVEVEIDPYEATPTLHILLHQDAGSEGDFESPGADRPLTAGEEVVGATISIHMDLPLAEITVADQEITREGEPVVVDSVTAPAAGWAALYADDDGAPGALLGVSPVREGRQEGVPIDFDWRQGTRRMHVMLYEDAGESGQFEPDEADRPFMAGAEPTAAIFTATLPPDALVFNQPGTLGEIIISRAFVNEAGWAVVYNDYFGMVADRLGYVPLEPGVTEHITVAVDSSLVTPVLHVMLHEDDETMGEFEYPRADEAIQANNRILLFSFATDAGNYLLTEDQSIGEEGTVHVPLVVSDAPTWVVVQDRASAGEDETAVEESAPPQVLGRTLLPAGVHRNVSVAVNPREIITSTLYVTLYHDLGEPGSFEAPEGADEPMVWAGIPIQVPFTVLESAVPGPAPE